MDNQIPYYIRRGVVHMMYPHSLKYGASCFDVGDNSSTPQALLSEYPSVGNESLL